MAMFTVANRGELLDEISKLNRSSDDTVKIAGGVVIDEFIWPVNMTRPLTLAPASISNPPIMRGIKVGGSPSKGNFDHLGGAPYATILQNLTIDGLLFYAKRFTSAVGQFGDTISLLQPDGQGLGWRCCGVGSQHPASGQGYSETSNMRALGIGQESRFITVRNCVFNGYANVVSFSADDVTIEWCHFQDSCEDILKPNGANRLKIQWNQISRNRGPSYQQAWQLGFGGAVFREEYPHGDLIQLEGVCNDAYFGHNWLDDDRERIHGGLFANPENNPRSARWIVENNELHLAHDTGFNFSHVNDLTCRRNKITPYPGGAARIQFVRDVIGGKLTDNMAGDYWVGAAGAIPTVNTGNQSIGSGFSPNTYPANFQLIKESQVPAGPHVGPYGQGGVVVPPTKPTQLTNPLDAVAEATVVVDPLLPAGDQRRALVIAIRPQSPAAAATFVRWMAEGDTGARTTVEIAPIGSVRRFRTTSNVTTGVLPHLRYPGEAFEHITVQYSNSVTDTSRSDLSSFELASVVVPEPPGEQVWIPSNKIEFPLHRGFYKGGDTLQEIAYLGEVLWNKPKPELVGAGWATLSIPQPSIPSAYEAGDFLPVLAYHVGATLFGNPAPALWSEAIIGGMSGNNQGIALIKGFATAPSMTLGTFTGTVGKVVAASYRGVHDTIPYYMGTPLLNASAVGVQIPGITIPAGDDDNYRILIWACNATGQVMTTPTGYRVVHTTGGTPRITLFESIDAKAAFAGLTVGMSVAAQSAGISMALKLAA